MPVIQSEAPWPALRRASRTVVVVDVVESVRLMEQDEDDTIRRWQSFVGEVVTRLLPPSGGRLVKSLGDGLMLEFESVPPAIQCALAMQQAIQPHNHGRPSEQWMCLRIGMHVADVVVDAHDIYGSGVNLAARLGTLAGSGEVVVSAEVRDGLVPGLDADVTDLGACYLKNVAEPVRAFRVAALVRVGAAPTVPAPLPRQPALAPAIAVLPFACHGGDPADAALGAVLADDLTAALARSEHWCVVSALSAAALAGRTVSPALIQQALKVDYALTGSLWRHGSRMHLNLQLVDARSDAVVWSQVHDGPLDELFEGDAALVPELAREMSRGMLRRELTLARAVALPNLPGYALLLDAITAMHRLAPAESGRSRQVLEHLVDRHPQSAQARAWLAKWHFMQLPQGLSQDRSADIDRARFQLRVALDRAPDHALSLALDGHLSAYVDQDLAAAEKLLRVALASNPNEPLAWLFLANVLAGQGLGAEAVDAVERAGARSPLDPLGYFFDALAAVAYNAADRFDDAEHHARRSLKANAVHLPSWVELIIAQALAGRMEAAQASARHYLPLRPGASVQRFFDRHPGGGNAVAWRDAHALREAGLPW